MWRTAGLATAMMALVILVPTDAHGQKKENKKKNAAERAGAEDYARLANVKQLGGKVVSADPGSKTFTLRVEVPHVEPNPNYNPAGGGGDGQRQLLQRLQQMARQGGQRAMTGGPAQRQQQLRRALQQMQRTANGQGGGNNGPYRVTTTAREYELGVSDKVVVRKLALGVEYDDRGNVKEYTKAQVAELRGNDPARPGYAAKYEDLEPGAEVVLHLTRPKTTPKVEKDAAIDPDMKPTVRMIVLTKARAAAAAESGKKK